MSVLQSRVRVFGLVALALCLAPGGAVLRAGAAEPAAAEPKGAAAGPVYDLLLRGGRIVDGTGSPWYEGDLAIRGDRIAAIGRLKDATARTTLDVRGLVVAPGFIDLLGQSEFSVLVDPHVRSKITQGITTELTGEGGSIAPQTPFTIEQLMPGIAEYNLTVDWRDLDGYAQRLRRKGTAINFAHLVGATQVRMAVLKSDNVAPNAAQLEEMKRLVARTMEQGAFGLSSSLIYTPAIFARTDELVALAGVAASYGGFYASHVRNESDRLVPAIEEAIAIGEQAKIPVEVWHFKSAGKPNWGRIKEGIAAIEAGRAKGVDITADLYPYPASSTDLSACLPPSAQEGGLQALVARLKDPAERARIRAEIESPKESWDNLFTTTGAENILIAGVKKAANKKFQGKRLSEIAADRGVDAYTAMFDLLQDEDGTVSTIYFEMSEDDIRTAMVQPWVAFDCDSEARRPDGILGESMTHPRSYGTFPRILGRYVREQKLLRLEEAVRKMTSLAARRIGLQDRGLLKPGLYADVTVFDPATVIDRSTFEAPHQFSEGIVHVIVNGQPVLQAGRVTERLPGRLLRGPGARGGH